MAESVVTLTNLAGGAALELFQSSLNKVVADIMDVNTDPEQARGITLQVQIKPGEGREIGDVTIKCSQKLAGMNAVTTRFYLGRHKGQPIAVEHDPRQSRLFDGPPEVPISMEKEA